jgi:Pectinacetylesterase
VSDDGGGNAPTEGGNVSDDASSAEASPSCPPNESSITSYAAAAAPVLSALDPNHSDTIPGDAGNAPPSGWNFYKIDGAICRDGSPMGIYVRYASMAKLMIYLEGGGLCFSSHFCDHNPANMQQQFSADPQTMGQTVGGSLGNLISPPILQKPWSTGIFDMNNAQNPVKGWSQVYVPYCTGDGHFGTIDSGSVTDYLNGQGSPGTSSVNPGYHFVGYNNMQKIAGHLAATFTGLDQMMLTGASAGGLGAVFNATMVEETFGGKVPTTVLIDSAAGFPDVKYMSACLQKNARSTFGWDAALPSDCADCRQSDGSGIINIVKYLHNRYPTDRLGLLMSIHDQIFRLFFGSGMGSDSTQPQDCDTNDPNLLAGLGLGAINPVNLRYPAALWEEGLGTLRTTYDCTGVFSSYYIGTADPSDSPDPVSNPIDTLHMHSFRDRYYDNLAGSMSPAQWTADLLAGRVEDIGP